MMGHLPSQMTTTNCVLLLVCFLLIATSIKTEASQDVQIYSISYHNVGTGGSSRIVASGKNLDVEFDWTNNLPRIRMFFVSSNREYECDYQQSESSATQAVCITRSMLQGDYYLRMKVEEEWLTESQYCSGRLNDYDCRLYVRNSYTPSITRLEKNSTLPQSLITLFGKTFDIRQDPNYSTYWIKSVSLTSGSCSLYRNDGRTYETSSRSNYGTVSCFIKSSYVGNQNISFIVQGASYYPGASVPASSTYHISASNQTYMLQTFAVVDNVSPKTSGVEGGSKLKISGKFFGSSLKATKVKVGKVNCKVESVTPDEIVCVVGARPEVEADSYPGGRGSKLETLHHSSITFDDASSSGYKLRFVDSIYASNKDFGANLVRLRVTGFFIPSITAQHRLFFASKNGHCPSCQLYLKLNKTLELVTTSASYRSSDPLSLERGKQYLYEIRANFSESYENMIFSAFVNTKEFESYEHVTEGNGLLMDPIGGDFLRTAHSTPQVQVFINDIPSKCGGDFDDDNSTSCGFEWKEEQTPTVELVEPIQGSYNTTVFIAGQGFSASKTEVKIAGVVCPVIFANETAVECRIGMSPAGKNQPLTISVEGKGLARINSAYNMFAVLAQVKEVLPESGSSAGCSELSITGSGFGSVDTRVKLGNSDCAVTSVMYDLIRCVSQQSVDVGPVNVIVSFPDGDDVVLEDGYEFLNSSVGKVDLFSPKIFRVSGGERANVTGTGFGLNGSVVIGESFATIVSWADDEIVFETPSLPVGTYKVQINSQHVGCVAGNSVDDLKVEYVFKINSISPSTGSILGGTKVLLEGEGFSDGMQIKMDGFACDLIDVEDSKAICVTTQATKLHQIDNSGFHETYGVGYAWNPSVLRINVGDEVNFVWSTTNGVEGASIGLFTCSSPASDEYDEMGFNVEPTQKGSFTHRFTSEGTFYYKSISTVYPSTTIVMSGQVVVSRASDKMTQVTAMLGGQAAFIATDLNFTFSSDTTPLISEISETLLDINTELNLKTTPIVGLPKITVGGKNCAVNEKKSNQSHWVCKVPVHEELPFGRHQVQMSVPMIGNALVAINNTEERSVVFLPTLDRVSPISGSMAGFTLLTIEGSGFTETSQVYIGSFLTCKNVEVTYSTIKCLTQPFNSRNQTFKVFVQENGYRPESESVFTYLEEQTPQVSNIQVDSNGTNYKLNITGKGFGSLSSDVNITIGDVTSCAVTLINDEAVTCEVEDQLVVGRHQIFFRVIGKGAAAINDSSVNSIESEPIIYSIEPLAGSLEGGTILTIKGNGFSDNSTMVEVGGIPCDVESASTDSITCITRKSSVSEYQIQITSNSVIYPNNITYLYSADHTPTVDLISPSEAFSGEQLTLTGSFIGSTPADIFISSVLDEEASLCDVNFVNETSLTCKLNSHQGGPVNIKVNVRNSGFAVVKATFYYSLKIESLHPTSGSFGGGQSLTVFGQGFSERSVVQLGDSECKITFSNSTMIRCLTPSQSVDALTDESVTAEVKVSNEGSSSPPSAYVYSINQTAVVSDVQPSRGGTAGGTLLIISGQKFGLAGLTAKPRVVIGGIHCEVKTFNETNIQCETKARPEGTIKTKVEVYLGENGIAQQDNADFWYIDRWSSKFTWGGEEIPDTGTLVVIPKNKTILLDTSTDVLKLLLIDGGKLIFDSSRNISLHAESILITNGGVLQVGTEEEPYIEHAEIVLHGHLRSTELPLYGAKVLALREGTLDIHGKPVSRTWSLLESTALNGTEEINLQQSVDWEVGDEIAIASTGQQFSVEENEKRTITAISPDGKQLTIDEPLKFKHLGIRETFGDKQVDLTAEVLLLTRNVVIRGYDDPQWHDNLEACEDAFIYGGSEPQNCYQERIGNDIGSDGFGGVVMIRTDGQVTSQALVKMENVEFTHMGQAQRTARNPLYWIDVKNTTGSYVKGCSIHETFNRAIAVVGTEGLVFDNNVVYDVTGIGIYIQDSDCVLRNNVVVDVKQGNQLTKDDILPGGFWIAVAGADKLELLSNRAAGTSHHGFVLTQRFHNQHTFKNNTAHSMGQYGFYFLEYVYYSRISGLTAWNNAIGALISNCYQAQFSEFALISNSESGMELGIMKYYQSYGLSLNESLIVGFVSETESSIGTNFGIIMPQGMNHVIVENTHFLNFVGQSSAMSCINNGGVFCFAKGLSFTNVDRRIVWDEEYFGAFRDIDGSLTESAENSTLLPSSNLFNSPSCQVQNGTKFSGRAFASTICDPSVRIHRARIYGISLDQRYLDLDVNITNKYGSSLATKYYSKNRWFILYGGETHTIKFELSEDFHYTNTSYYTQYYDFERSDFVIMKQHLNSTPDRINMGNGYENLTQSTALNSNSSYRQWSYDTNSSYFSYFVGNTNPISSGQYYSFRVELEKLPERDPEISYGDPLPPDISVPDNAFYWSSLGLRSINDSTDHPCVRSKNGVVEILRSAEGFDLCWCIVDIADIKLDHFLIGGVVQFSDDVPFESFNLTAHTIRVVNGRLIAGLQPDMPFTKQLTINLEGKSTDETSSVEGVEIGQKVLACLGGCDFHGMVRNVTWSDLAESCDPNSTTLTLRPEVKVDWKVGEEIIVTSVGSDHIEQRRIAEVKSGNRIVVDEPLRFRHLVNNFTRSEVALLDRSIKIKGGDLLDGDQFGAKVLITSNPSSNIYGWARFSNVEFIGTGQDSSYGSVRAAGLEWRNAGRVAEERPSSIEACVFRSVSTTAIQASGSDGLRMTRNVIHMPRHGGLDVDGSEMVVEENLVAGSSSVCYRLSVEGWMRVEGNVATGCQLAGFDTNGQPCHDPHRWTGNVARGCSNGVAMSGNFRQHKCALLENFTVHKSSRIGVYHQTSSNVVIRDTVIADSKIGYAPFIYGPDARSHQFEDKKATLENCVVIGRSGDDDESVSSSGNIGVLLPIFSSRPNYYTSYYPGSSVNYAGLYSTSTNSPPAIRGSLNISGCEFSDFRQATGDVIFRTNSNNEDAYAMTLLNDVTMTRVDRNSMVFYQRPSLSLVTTSVCFDMECDGFKNVLVKDLDGSFLGSPGAIVPDAAYGWGDDSGRGLGDNRIPRTLLTDLDGRRKPVDEIIDYRGIAGTNNCTYVDEWQAFDCHGPEVSDYTVLVLENMDEDSETRPLSPVAFLADRYIDLQNGPRAYLNGDRLSTFHTVVATGTHYEIHFTGYPPLDMRIHLLNVNLTTTVRLAIYYPKPERLDVYNDNVYIHPLNSRLNSFGEWVTVAPRNEFPDEFVPSLASTIHGANYMDRTSDVLYITVCGPDPINVRTYPAVVVKFGFPAISVDEFFGDNLVSNLASYLGIPSSKIKIVNIVRETSSRKRRSTDSEKIFFVFKFDDGVIRDNSTSTNLNDTKSVSETLNRITDGVVRDFQTGVLSSILNVSSILEMEATTSALNISSILDNATMSEVIHVPTKQNLTVSIATFEELSEIAQFSSALLDSSGLPISRLGGEWKARLRIIPQAGVDASIIGADTSEFVAGLADFGKLAISNPGTHTVEIKVTEPGEVSYLGANVTVEVLTRQVKAALLSKPLQLIPTDDLYRFVLRLSDKDGQNLTNIGYKGNAWKVRSELLDPESYGGVRISGKSEEEEEEVEFDNRTGMTDGEGVMLSNTSDYFRYQLKLTVFSDPPIYPSITLYTPPVQVYPSWNPLHELATVKVHYKVKFEGSIESSKRSTNIDELSGDEMKEAFSVSFNNFVTGSLTTSYVSSLNTTQTDEGGVEVEFVLDSVSGEGASEAESALESRFSSPDTSALAFNGRTYTIADIDNCYLRVEGVCKSTTGVGGASPIKPASLTAIFSFLIAFMLGL